MLPSPAMRRVAPGNTRTSPVPSGVPVVPVTCTVPDWMFRPPLQVFAVPEMMTLRRLSGVPLVLFRAPLPMMTPANSTRPAGPVVVLLMTAKLPRMFVVPATRRP